MANVNANLEETLANREVTLKPVSANSKVGMIAQDSMADESPTMKSCFGDFRNEITMHC
jgi:hypothetical protein